MDQVHSCVFCMSKKPWTECRWLLDWSVFYKTWQKRVWFKDFKRLNNWLQFVRQCLECLSFSLWLAIANGVFFYLFGYDMSVFSLIWLYFDLLWSLVSAIFGLFAAEHWLSSYCNYSLTVVFASFFSRSDSVLYGFVVWCFSSYGSVSDEPSTVVYHLWYFIMCCLLFYSVVVVLCSSLYIIWLVWRSM